MDHVLLSGADRREHETCPSAVLILKQQQIVSSSIYIMCSRAAGADEWLIFLCPLCFCSRKLMFTARTHKHRGFYSALMSTERRNLLGARCANS